MKPEIKDKSALEFWEERYNSSSGETSGKPSMALECYAKNRPQGTALDLGCAKGDDAVWLAKQGWNVLGVDISAAALKHTAANAARNGVELRLEQHDLSESFPSGEFDLISANFLQTPYEFPWEDVIRRAAAAIRPGGLLLAVTHVDIKAHNSAMVFRLPAALSSVGLWLLFKLVAPVRNTVKWHSNPAEMVHTSLDALAEAQRQKIPVPRLTANVRKYQKRAQNSKA